MNTACLLMALSVVVINCHLGHQRSCWCMITTSAWTRIAREIGGTTGTGLGRGRTSKRVPCSRLEDCTVVVRTTAL